MAMFINATRLLEHGQSPYDHDQLYRTEVRYLRRARLALPTDRPVVRVGNPPLFFKALQPFAAVPFGPLAIAWDVLMYALSALGLLAALSYFGWQRRVLPCLIFLLMPQTVLGAYYGNVTPLVFAAIAGALATSRRFPVLAGALLSVAWLKPPVALPLALLVALFYVPDRKRLAAGFFAATALCVALTYLTVGGHMIIFWMQGMMGYSRDIAISPNISSLAGLYVRWAPSSTRLLLEALTCGLALLATGIALKRSGRAAGSAPVQIGLLWFAWFLATPYAHFYDEVLLVIPLLGFLGRNGREALRASALWSLYLMLLSLLLLSWAPGGVQFLAIPLILVALCAFRLGKKSIRYANLPALEKSS